MKKILLLFVTVFAIHFCGIAQSAEETKVNEVVQQLSKGLIDGDRTLLESITADELSYGHSSGKVENRTEFITAAVSGPFDFISIDLADQKITIKGDLAMVRHVMSAKISNNGTPGDLKLGILLVLQKQKGKWKLMGRQAYRL